MNKFLLFALVVLTQIVSLQAYDVEARVAYFIPEDNRLRHIYGNNGFAEYELEASMPLCCCCECACDWDAFANLAYYDKKGRVSSCVPAKSEVTHWAFNVGVKRYFDICEIVRPYLGLGAGFAHVRFHDKSPFVRQHRDKWGVATLIKSGIKYDVTCNIFLDLFVDYTYHFFNFNRYSCSNVRSVNTGGFKIGLGLGYQF